jgi:hypothetical protein
MPLVDRFQNEANIFVFLISTLAGGTGLTLTAANKVVVFGNRSLRIMISKFLLPRGLHRPELEYVHTPVHVAGVINELCRPGA